MQNIHYQNQYQQDLSHSRVLYEQVIQDNQPTQQQILNRAQELQIDDLLLAKQSLIKELQPFWRPYVNRYGDIYYINLKERKAYVDHPIDMETKTLYAKRHRKQMSKFKAYTFEEVSNSVNLIEDQIEKWKLGDMMIRTSQYQPGGSKLNIVYEQSQQSNTQRQKSQEQQYQQEPKQNESQDSYIENLQNQQIIPHKKKPTATTKQSGKTIEIFKQNYKKFPLSQREMYQSQQNQQNDDDQQAFSPQYQKQLLKYEQQLRSKNQLQLKEYQQQNQQNYLKRQKIYRQDKKAKLQLHKFTLISQFQCQIQQKNAHQYEKQLLKLNLLNKQKINQFQNALVKYQQSILNLRQVEERKQIFIDELQTKLEKRIIQGKENKIYKLKGEIQKTRNNLFHQKFVQSKQNFSKQLFVTLNRKFQQTLKKKGIKDQNHKISHPSSLSEMYSTMVEKQLRNIDNMLMNNEISQSMRYKYRSTHNKIQNIMKQDIQQTYQNSKNRNSIFIPSNVHYREEQKENNNLVSNSTFEFNKPITNIVKDIQTDIQERKQKNQTFTKRRKRIFSQAVNKNGFDCNNFLNYEQNSTQSNKINQSNQKKEIYQYQKIINNQLIGTDKKSLYLRMMKKIL